MVINGLTTEIIGTANLAHQALGTGTLESAVRVEAIEERRIVSLLFPQRLPAPSAVKSSPILGCRKTKTANRKDLGDD